VIWRAIGRETACERVHNWEYPQLGGSGYLTPCLTTARRLGVMLHAPHASPDWCE